MATYKTKGIIIKRRNFGEADRILTIYTEKYGKISAIAKGVRRPLSKLGGHLELFYLTDFIFAEGKNLDTVTAAELIEDFPDIRKDKTKSNHAFYISEILNFGTKENEESREIFLLLKNTLSKIETQESPLATSYFSLHMMSELGHRPELGNCIKCQKKLVDSSNYFSIFLGGIICSDCQKYDIESRLISNDIIKLARILLDGDIDIIDKIQADRAACIELQEILNNFSEGIIERKIVSYRYLNK